MVGLARLFIGGVGLYGAIYTYDYNFRYQRLHRNVRTVLAAASTIIDYKVVYGLHPERLEAIHDRVATRLAETCARNGGLYIKLGQSIASLNHVLPPTYRRAFEVLQDQAPATPYSEIEQLFKDEFGGKKPEEIFAEFDPIPIASASIAQVHKAVLHDGRHVAVKIQKPSIRVQMSWDLFMYQCMVWSFEKMFDLPMYWAVKFTKQTLLKEADFLNEAYNSEVAKSMFSDRNFAPKYLRNHVYIPDVVKEYTSSRVLTLEWIDGVKITNKEELQKQNYSIPNVVDTFVHAFGYQIFQTGFVHCDPHPGNVMVRRCPSGGQHQVVLLDHGMYIQENEGFRQQYASLWKAMFLLDKETLHSVCRSWGINDPEFFASLQLMRPYSSNRAVHVGDVSRKDVQEMQKESKRRIKKLLSSTKNLPRELIFIGRCMNLVRATNRDLGSPVNRVNILANYAAQESSFSLFSWVKFRTQLFLMSVHYHISQYISAINESLGWNRSAGFEDALEQSFQTLSVEEKMGFRVQVDNTE